MIPANPQVIHPQVYESFVDSPELRAFLNHVFKQVDTEKFMRIYREAVQQNGTTEGIYRSLYERANEAKGNFISKISIGLNALKQEKKTLGDNIAKIMDPNRLKEGYIEIGLPGRMINTLKAKAGLAGPVAVVNENESRIQSGFPRPYHRFDKLTYDPLPANKESVALISCFAGLHHCPPEKLNAFIDSIHETLAPGGVFLLREHDARTQRLNDLAAVVHSVFNAATGVKPVDEAAEVRNFKSIQEWKELLEARGFRLLSSPLYREGDSSLNGLLKFVKIDPQDELQTVREKLIDVKPNYTRRRMQTHLTAVEWFNVESSQNLGNVKAFWDYPYFRDCSQLWKTLFNSTRQAAKVEKFSKILSSDYALMNGILTSLMTVEFLAKGILYTPLWAAARLSSLVPGKTDDVWKQPAENYQEFLRGYGDRLEVTPFYAQRFLPSIKGYWSNLSQKWAEARKTRSTASLVFDRQTISNAVTGTAMTADLLFRSTVATAINASLGGEENGDDRQIGVIVKRTENERNPLTANPAHTISVEGSRFEGLIVPRYKELEQFLRQISANGVEICELAGQKVVQVDLVVDIDNKEHAQHLLYERAFLPDAKKKIVALQVPVNELPRYLNANGFHRLYDF